ncbi:MAG: DUF454 family protein [bacterium]|nr:DUF454 family protein [Gammaproteobacteria bacterium]HIL99102.1 DUF454 family protein [Pseudomonadales bacterium]
MGYKVRDSTLTGPRLSRTGKSPGFHIRLVYLVVAVVCIMIGIVGLLVPIIPGVLFLVAAVYFLGKVSNRIRRWTAQHPVLSKIQSKFQRMNSIDVFDRVKVISLMSLEMLVTAIDQGFQVIKRARRTFN